MKVLFRVDASIDMGTGHVMRCLTLADSMASQGAECYFICREHVGNLIDTIRQRGHLTYSLILYKEFSKINNSSCDLKHSDWLGATQEEDAILCSTIIKSIQPDWVVIDHYGLDFRWERIVKPYFKRLMIIDDLADRKHECNILLDQTLGRDKNDYIKLVPEFCELLCGANNALLRPEFIYWREYSLKRRTNVGLRRILINLGGVDKDNITTMVLSYLEGSVLPSNCQITVVMGKTAPWVENVRNQAALMKWKTEVKVGVENMAELMANSDLAIGAAGSTSWERCCLGLPTIMLVLAENQILGAEELERNKAVISLKTDKNMKLEIIKIIKKLRYKPSLLEEISISSRNISDGSGSNIIVKKLMSFN